MFFGEWIKMFHGAIDGMYEIVSDLKKKGFGLYGLSNWAAATFDKYVGPNFPVFRLLEGMVVSGHEFCIKPDEKIYRLLLDRYRLMPEECVFVDDSIPNLEGAARLGIHTYHFTGAKTFAADLDRIINID
jgi:2-haloacid dehalogenase